MFLRFILMVFRIITSLWACLKEIGEIYLFCIYFSLNNFNYPNKKLTIPSKLRNSSAEFPQNFCGRKKQNLLGFWGPVYLCRNNIFSEISLKIPHNLLKVSLPTLRFLSNRMYVFSHCAKNTRRNCDLNF